MIGENEKRVNEVHLSIPKTFGNHGVMCDVPPRQLDKFYIIESRVREGMDYVLRLFHIHIFAKARTSGLWDERSI